jgi:Xaa-Pro aminopeptidase
MVPYPKHVKHFTPGEEITNRLAKLQALLSEQDIACAWLDQTSDLLYFSGSIQSAILLVPAEGPVHYVVKKSQSRAKIESPLEVTPFTGTKKLFEILDDLLGQGQRQLGLCLDVTPANQYLRLSNSLSNCQIKDIALTIRKLRAIKSNWEIEQIQKAADQVTKVFHQMPGLLVPNTTELELSAKIEALCRLQGHGGPIRIRRPGLELSMHKVVSGESGCYPSNFDGPVGGHAPFHSVPGGAGYELIQDGSPIMCDLVSQHNSYHADTTRIFVKGHKVSDQAQKNHDFCLAVLDKIEEQLKPGNNCQEIYRSVAEWAQNNGQPEGFMGHAENQVKFFGHGVGLELDEFPILADKIDIELQAGMVLAVEPKVFQPDNGSVGIETTYVIEENGFRPTCIYNQQISLI